MADASASATLLPLGLPNAGSIFKNPRGEHAGRLIEAAGLKGWRVGGARFSERHANFIVTGAATAADVKRLMDESPTPSGAPAPSAWCRRSSWSVTGEGE
jgi:UDP-N-acetylenolpyruvoylglucosamine reductase